MDFVRLFTALMLWSGSVHAAEACRIQGSDPVAGSKGFFRDAIQVIRNSLSTEKCRVPEWFVERNVSPERYEAVEKLLFSGLNSPRPGIDVTRLIVEYDEAQVERFIRLLNAAMDQNFAKGLGNTLSKEQLEALRAQAFPNAKEAVREVVKDAAIALALLKEEARSPSRDRAAFLDRVFTVFYERARSGYQREADSWGVAKEGSDRQVRCESIHDMPVDGYLAERAVKALICERRHLPPEKWSKESDFVGHKQAFFPYYLEAAGLIDDAANAGLKALDKKRGMTLKEALSDPDATLFLGGTESGKKLHAWLLEMSGRPFDLDQLTGGKGYTDLIRDRGPLLTKAKSLTSEEAEALYADLLKRNERGDFARMVNQDPATYEVIYRIAEALEAKKKPAR